MKKINIFIIHYSKLNDRKEHMEQLMSNSPFNYEYIENFDKETLTQKIIESIYEPNENKFLQKSKLWKARAIEYSELKIEEISCAKKHIFALEKIKNNSNEYCLIIEDDVIPIYSDFFSKIEKLIKNSG